MDPMTIIAGVKLATAGVDLALDAAEGAVKRIKRAMAVGKEIGAITHDLGTFFSAQGEIEAAAKKQQDDARAAKARGERLPRKSALSEAFDIVVAARQLREFETELREWMIWTGNGDFYQELIDERARIIAEREQERIDDIKEQKRLQRAAEKKVEQRIQLLQDAGAVILGGIVIVMLCYGIWWMVHFNDRL